MNELMRENQYQVLIWVFLVVVAVVVIAAVYIGIDLFRDWKRLNEMERNLKKR